MSKIGVLVKCSDGKWYSHPILGIDDNWFICYDPIELVISAKSIGKARVVARIVESHFRKRGSSIELKGNVRPCGERLFQGKQDKRAKFKQAYNVWVYMNNPPVDLILRHSGVFETRPKMEGVYYD